MNEIKNLGNRQLLSMAMAYLEVGKVAAEADTQHRREGDYQNAVAYQLFHSIELFYKFMIQIKIGNFAQIHDLRKLEENYSLLYPGDSYAINHPFDFSNYDSCELNQDEEKLYAKHINNFNPKYMDQHLRYPADKRTGGYLFSLESSVFEKIKNRMLEISQS